MTRQRFAGFVHATVLAVLLVTTACGDGGSSPSAPSPPVAPPEVTPPVGAAPALQLAVVIDDTGASDATDAIALLSRVAVEAKTSASGGPYTFAIDFGDGATSTQASSAHVYSSRGRFVVAATVRDAQGRTATASRDVNVEALTGAWFHAGVNEDIHSVQVRRLAIDAQDGLTVRGRYGLSNSQDRTFTGTLSAPRNLRLVTDNGVSFEGSVPGRIHAEGPWPLAVVGDGARGELLPFRAVTEQPTGPPPDAILNVRADTLGSVGALAAVSSTEFSATLSRGDGLSYFMEYGDGQISTDAHSFHTILAEGRYRPRLTVVDRFGRSDSETTDLFVGALQMYLEDAWIANGFRLKFFSPASDRNYQGEYQADFKPRVAATAAITGERGVHVTVPSLGIEFDGYIEIGNTEYATFLHLTQSGGVDHGRSFRLRWDDGPG